MLRHGLPLLLLVLCSATLAGTVTGHVFLDGNKDGQWQAGEDPLPGVLVSDGLAFAATGADGAYQLTTPDGDQVVFLDNPTGTWPTRGFYRNVKVGPAVADFPLSRQEQKLPFTFVQGTDLHIRPDIAPQMAQYVKAINSLPITPAFVVHTGDLVVDTNGQTVEGARKLFSTYQEMVKPLQAPLFNLPGNHEHVGVFRKDAPQDAPGYGKGLYREVFGPMYYAFTYAGVHFIALDGTDLPNGKLQYAIPQVCLDWLRGYLERVDQAAPLILLVHEPIAPSGEKARVEPLLAGHKVLLTLSGHWHSIGYYTLGGGPEIVSGATSYAWHGTAFAPNPMGYQVVQVKAEGVQTAFGDWAQPYPVTVVSPPRSLPLGNPVKVDLHFLDLASEVTEVTVALENATQTVRQFETQNLERTFTCELPAADLCAGFHDLLVTLRGKGEPTTQKQPFLVLGGPTEAFTAAGPATFRGKAHSVQADISVKLNGEEVGKILATAGAEQTVRLTLPADKLRRLNVVELVSTPLADGSGYDDFTVDYTDVIYQDKLHRDYRLYAGGVGGKKSATAQTGTLYYDLTRPVQ